MIQIVMIKTQKRLRLQKMLVKKKLTKLQVIKHHKQAQNDAAQQMQAP